MLKAVGFRFVVIASEAQQSKTVRQLLPCISILGLTPLLLWVFAFCSFYFSLKFARLTSYVTIVMFQSQTHRLPLRNTGLHLSPPPFQYYLPISAIPAFGLVVCNI